MFTNNKTPTSRFSGWALDDDVENTVLQVNETMDPGIPSMPSTPKRPLSRYTFAQPQPMQPQTYPSFMAQPPQQFMASMQPITSQQPQPITSQPQQFMASMQPITSQPHPITSQPQQFMASMQPITSMQPHPITSQPQPITSMQPSYKRHYHRGVLETRESGEREYITIEDIFEYVTLGRTISDNYLDGLTKYVVDEVPTTLTTTLTETSFHGRAYKRETPMYSWEKYGVIAKCCLEWVLSNPEKIGRGAVKKEL
jgi:hypothetical protein